MGLLNNLSRPRNVWAFAGLIPLLASAVVILESGLEGTVIQVALSDVAGDIPEFSFDGHGGVGYVVGMSLIATLGAVIVTRFSNPIGALVTLAVFTDVIGAAIGAYGYRSIIVGELPGGVVVGLVGSAIPVLLLVLVVPAFILHFPTGRLRTTRWRWVLRLGALVATYLIVAQLLYPLVLGLAANPIGASWSLETADEFLGLGWTAWTGVMALAASSVIWRVFDGFRWVRTRSGARSKQPTSATTAT